MHLAEIYAQTIFKASVEKESKDFDTFFTKFVDLLKTKNHYKMLPMILNKVEMLVDNAQANDKTVLIVREATLADTYKKELGKCEDTFCGEVEVVENPNIVGGFIAKNKTSMLDGSYRSRLLALYKQLTT